MDTDSELFSTCSFDKTKGPLNLAFESLPPGLEEPIFVCLLINLFINSFDKYVLGPCTCYERGEKDEVSITIVLVRFLGHFVFKMIYRGP